MLLLGPFDFSVHQFGRRPSGPSGRQSAAARRAGPACGEGVIALWAEAHNSSIISSGLLASPADVHSILQVWLRLKVQV